MNYSGKLDVNDAESIISGYILFINNLLKF